MTIKVNGTGFNSESVLSYKTKEEWIEWASISHFVGYNETAKLKALTHVWNEAQKLKPKEVKVETEKAAPKKTAKKNETK